MADKLLVFRENSIPGDVTFALKDRRNEDDPRAVVDITGYVFKLIVKRNLEDADADAFFDLTGSIVSATDGTFKFVLTAAHTSFPPENYVGEIRWWTSAPGTEEPPLDSFSVSYSITGKVRRNEP